MCSQVRGSLDNERGAALGALREYQKREEELSGKLTHLEEENRQLKNKLREEQAAVQVLKRQALDYQDELDELLQAESADQGDPTLRSVLDSCRQLTDREVNPAGEQYAIAKVLQTYHAELRSIFLYYCQLEQSFTNHWPPRMKHNQWLLFAKDAEVTDNRPGARIRSNVHAPMLGVQDVLDVFQQFSVSHSDDGAPYPAVTYEAFLSALVYLAFRLQPKNVPFLSESLRLLITRQVNKAHKVQPVGIKSSRGRKSSLRKKSVAQARGQGVAPLDKGAEGKLDASIRSKV